MHDLTPAQVAQLCSESLPDALVEIRGRTITIDLLGNRAAIGRLLEWVWHDPSGHRALTHVEDLGMALCQLAQLPTPWSHLLADLRDQGVQDAPAALLGNPRALVACARRLSP